MLHFLDKKIALLYILLLKLIKIILLWYFNKGKVNNFIKGEWQGILRYNV